MKFNEIPFLKILFAISIITFFVIFTVYVINLAQGRTFSSDDGSFVNTSIIRINSNPTDVKILVNGEEKQPEENRIEGLTPGEVTLTLTKDGYSKWEKTVTLRAGVVKDVFVQLFPSDLNLEQITTSNVDQIVSASEPNYIYYSIIDSEIESEAGLYRQRLTRNLIDFGEIEPEKIADYSNSLITILSENTYRLSVSDDNNQILLDVPEKKLLFAYNTSTLNQRINLSTLLGFYPTQSIWHQGSASLIVRNEGLIAEYFLNTNEQVVIDYDVANKTKFTKAGENIYFIRTRENLIYQYTNRRSELLTFPVGINIEGTFTNIFSASENPDTFVVNISGDFYYIDIEKSFIEKVGKNISIKAISSQGRTIIYQKDSLLFSYNLEETANQKSYDTFTKQIDLTAENAETLFFTPTGANIVVFNSDESGKRSLIFRDSDGQNPNPILLEEDIIGNEVLLTNDAKSLYLLLGEEGETNVGNDQNTDRKIQNIYRIDLEVE